MFRHLVGRHGQMSRVSMSLIVLLGAAVGVVASRLLGVTEWVLSLLVGAVFGALDQQHRELRVPAPAGARSATERPMEGEMSK
jgi:hypothetical protein